MHAGSSNRMDEQDKWDSTSLEEQDEPLDYLMVGYPVSIYCSKLTIETLKQGVLIMFKVNDKTPERSQ